MFSTIGGFGLKKVARRVKIFVQRYFVFFMLILNAPDFFALKKQRFGQP